MPVFTKKTLLVTLPLMLTACTYGVPQPYVPSGYNVHVTPAPHYYPKQYKQRPVYYVKQPHHEHHEHAGYYNER